MIIPPKQSWLTIEFILLCVVQPTIIIAFRLAPYMFFFLWVTAIIAYFLYRATPGVRNEPLWKWREVNWENLRPILLRFALSSLVMIAFVYAYIPERAFGLLYERPEIWWRVMILYPLLSAAPQEFIFCTFFFARYRFLFKNPRVLFFASVLVFAYAHVLYINWVAPVMSLVAGYFFAQTYLKTRSLALISIEHALYGNMMFTVGLGVFFFAGQ